MIFLRLDGQGSVKFWRKTDPKLNASSHKLIVLFRPGNPIGVMVDIEHICVQFAIFGQLVDGIYKLTNPVWLRFSAVTLKVDPSATRRGAAGGIDVLRAHAVLFPYFGGR